MRFRIVKWTVASYVIAYPLRFAYFSTLNLEVAGEICQMPSYKKRTSPATSITITLLRTLGRTGACYKVRLQPIRHH